MNKQVVITRMLYAENDPKFQERLAIYRALCLPRLRNQSVKDFDIAVLCNRKHAKIFKRLGVIPFFLKKEWFGKVGETGKWSAVAKWEDIEGIKKYDIQTNLDSDDLVSDKYVSAIQKRVGGKKSLHIHFQPRLFNFHTLEEKEMKTKYGKDRGSAFYSLYQPNKENYIYIGQGSHINMWKYASRSILLREGYCWVGIHGNNDSTTMNH